MNSSQNKRAVVYRYYSPWLTGAVGVAGIGCMVAALVWAGDNDFWPVLLAFIGGGLSSLAMGRGVLAEVEERRQW